MIPRHAKRDVELHVSSDNILNWNKYMKRVLHIDTSHQEKTEVAIVRKNSAKHYYKQKTYGHSQITLPLIIEALVKEELSIADISEISVNPGLGSFTGVRVGVAIANTLAWALKVPVNGKKFVIPVYSTSKFDTFDEA